MTDKKIGAQVEGVASIVRPLATLKWALKMWNRVNPGIGKIINIKNIQKKAISGRIYKITPNRIKFFSEQLYGDKEYEVFKIS